LKLYEFQSKSLLKRYGVCVPRGTAISDYNDAAKIFQEIGRSRCVVKAQIHAGGRGKCGGVQFVNSPEECTACAARMLGSRLITRQTGPEGAEVKYVFIEEALPIKKEFYLALMIDRTLRTPVLIAGSEGGVGIEEISKSSPEKIAIEPVDIFSGIHPFQLRRISSRLGISDSRSIQLGAIIDSLFSAFVQNDCALLEINPLAMTDDGAFYALDAKMETDDNALYRHPEFEQFISTQETSPAEALARKHRLSYVSLDGTIGCLVNGAGLAMATMDIIKLHGGEPANFLDVGGDATQEQVTQAFKIILSDRKVKSVFVNIFGGIMKCDVIAYGIIQAIKEAGIHIPLVVRLEGTNVELAKKALDDSGLHILSAKNMAEAAYMAVEASKRGANK